MSERDRCWKMYKIIYPEKTVQDFELDYPIIQRKAKKDKESLEEALRVDGDAEWMAILEDCYMMQNRKNLKLDA